MPRRGITRDMDTRLVAAAIPLFGVFIALELWVAHRRKVRVYRLFDAMSDLSCGISQQLCLLVSQAPLLVLYVWVQQNYALWSFEHTALNFALAWLINDFLYYWWHRASHRINWLWGLHVVHHQSEDFNLAVALRQAMFTHASAMFFYAPMAFLGFDVIIFGVVLALNTLVQFWIHTELIRKCGPIEWFFNTPSHHRVHHGINDEYLDTNYAGFLIIWDKMFGTFVPEEEEVVYGITKPLQSFNPFWANVHYFIELGQRSMSLSRWRDKLWVWWAPPEWLGAGEEAPAPAPQNRDTQNKYDLVASRSVIMGSLAIFTLIAASTLAMIVYGPSMSLPLLIAAVAGIYLLLWAVTWGRSQRAIN